MEGIGRFYGAGRAMARSAGVLVFVFWLGVAAALDAGRPTEGETQEEAGFRQAHKIIELFDEHH